MSWLQSLTPAQRRVAEEVFAAGAPRPPVDGELAASLWKALAAQTRAAADIVPGGEQLVLGKSALDALDCDGRYLDRRASSFSWSRPLVRGHLVHAAVAADHWGQRARPPSEVVAHAWRDLASSGAPAGRFLSGLRGVEADVLRGEVTSLLVEFRDLFPPLPERVAVRAEPALDVRLHEGRLVLRGRPDLVLGSAERERRRMVLLDFKSGTRDRARDGLQMRFYALLATLKYRVAPYRVATLSLDDGGWDVEDVDDGLLTDTVATVARKARRAAQLSFQPPAEASLRLVAGPACRWCARAAGCPAVAPRAVA